MRLFSPVLLAVKTRLKGCPRAESTTEAVTPGLSGALLMRSASWVSVVLALTATLTV